MRQCWTARYLLFSDEIPPLSANHISPLWSTRLPFFNYHHVIFDRIIVVLWQSVINQSKGILSDCSFHKARLRLLVGKSFWLGNSPGNQGFEFAKFKILTNSQLSSTAALLRSKFKLWIQSIATFQSVNSSPIPFAPLQEASSRYSQHHRATRRIVELLASYSTAFGLWKLSCLETREPHLPLAFWR